MRELRAGPFWVLLLLTAGCIGASKSSGLTKEIVFKLQAAVEPVQAISELSAAADLTAVTRVFRHAGRFEAQRIQHGLHLWYSAQTRRLTASAVQTLQAYSSLTSTAAIVPEIQLASDVPNDPEYPKQRHHHALGMEEAWSITGGSEVVVVAIIDSGVDMDHPDLLRNSWINEGEICGNEIDDDNNGYVDDCRGYNFADKTGTQLLGEDEHGTHVAGIVAADTNNEVGVAGTAGGVNGRSGVLLMHLTVFGRIGNRGVADVRFTFATMCHLNSYT